MPFFLQGLSPFYLQSYNRKHKNEFKLLLFFVFFLSNIQQKTKSYFLQKFYIKNHQLNVGKSVFVNSVISNSIDYNHGIFIIRS